MAFSFNPIDILRGGGDRVSQLGSVLLGNRAPGRIGGGSFADERFPGQPGEGARRRGLGGLLTNFENRITKDPLLDDITRNEILGLLNFDVMGQSRMKSEEIFSRAKSLYRGSRAGNSTFFQARHFLSNRMNMMKSRPGRDQLLLTDRGAVGKAVENLLTTL